MYCTRVTPVHVCHRPHLLIFLLVNAAAKQHNRIVYSSQAIHHVAHQIASLYWASVSQEVRSQATFAKGVEKTVDLSRHMYESMLGTDFVRCWPTWKEHCQFASGSRTSRDQWSAECKVSLSTHLDSLRLESFLANLVVQIPASSGETGRSWSTAPTKTAPTRPASASTSLARAFHQSPERYPAKSSHPRWRISLGDRTHAYAGGASRWSDCTAEAW